MRTNLMRSTDNVYYLPRRPRRAVAAARIAQQRGHEFLKAGFYMTGGAVIGFMLAKSAGLSAALTAVVTSLPPHGI
ncbi:MAG TPA: hypothetical protein VMC05_17245 [Xanthobacteraceae bacterium]|nr:hypothetical protein [Xanthobacteraceae bacterium]